FRERLVESDLQRVIVRAQPAVEPPGESGPPERDTEWPTRLALTDARRVDVLEPQLVGRERADVARGQRHVPRQPALVGEIPGLYVAAVDRVGIRRAHARVRGQIDGPGAQVRREEERDALLERAEGHVVRGAGKGEGDSGRVEPAQRS